MVTLIIHRLLEVSEKKAQMRKLNMVIGAFHSQLGRDLLRLLIAMDRNPKVLRKELALDMNWTVKKLHSKGAWVKGVPHKIGAGGGELTANANT